jgi:hypothetical protein
MDTVWKKFLGIFYPINSQNTPVTNPKQDISLFLLLLWIL